MSLKRETRYLIHPLGRFPAHLATNCSCVNERGEETMASRWGSTVLAATLLSLLLLSNTATAASDQELDAVAKVAENTEATTAADPVLRLPSDRSVPANEGSSSVEESVPLSGSKVDHQEADGSSTAETITPETDDTAAAIPSLKVSLIPIRRHGDGEEGGNGLHRLHLRGPRGFVWFMRPRHHSRLFHKIFLHGHQPDAVEPHMEVHLDRQHRAAQMILRSGLQLPLPMEMDQEQDQQQQQVPRVLAFRIRRLGPHHHHGMMHDCAWRKRLEALAGAAQGEQKGEADKPQEGFPRLVKRFTVLLKPQQN